MNTNDLYESILNALIESWADDPTHTVAESREQSLAVIKHVVQPVIADLERRLEMARGALQDAVHFLPLRIKLAVLDEPWPDWEQADILPEVRVGNIQNALAQLTVPLAPPDDDQMLAQLTAMIQKGFVTCRNEGDDEGGCVVIGYHDLKNAQELHRLIVTGKPAPLSPVEGTWSWALEQMKAGKRVIHAELTESIGLENDEFIRAELDPLCDCFAFGPDDFSATDWRIADEPAHGEGKESM